MSDDATPRLALPYLAGGQAQKHVTLNEALAALDGLVQTAVESRTLAAQPAGPADGALYILPASRSGPEWALMPPGALARFEADGWTALATGEGALAYVKDENRLLVRTDSGWDDAGAVLKGLQNLDHLGLGTTADATNPFSAKLNKLLFTARAAGEGGDGDLRLTLNKEAASDVLSLLLQSGFAGRAELGLIGDDHLTLKVSADGAAWSEALRVEPGGRVRLPGKIVAVAGRSAPASVAPGAWTPFVFDSEQLDTAGAYDPATGRFTCPVAGWYRVRADFLLNASTANGTGLEVRISRNGVMPSERHGHVDQTASGAHYPQLDVEHVLDCAAGDTLDVLVTGYVGPAAVFGDFTKLIVEHLG